MLVFKHCISKVLVSSCNSVDYKLEGRVNPQVSIFPQPILSVEKKNPVYEFSRLETEKSGNL